MIRHAKFSKSFLQASRSDFDGEVATNLLHTSVTNPPAANVARVSTVTMSVRMVQSIYEMVTIRLRLWLDTISPALTVIVRRTGVKKS